MVKIIIDSGHGGKDPGAVGNGLQEKNITLDISKEMKRYLDANYTRHETSLTRTIDIFLELSERTDIANRFNADVFISNHVNAGGGTGYESYIYTKPNAGSVKLQNLVNAEALATAKKYGLGPHGDDKKQGNLAVVRQTNMPAVLTEIAYIDSKDADLLKNNNFIKDMAAAYARGVAKYLNLPEKKVEVIMEQKTPEQIAYEKEMVDSIDFLKWKKVITEDRRNENITRGQMFLMLYRFYQNVIKPLEK
ncbi:N-acetylmuramoyl-L-alanine amidase family protein [Peribacillus sp. JNUCC 23]